MSKFSLKYLAVAPALLGVTLPTGVLAQDTAEMLSQINNYNGYYNDAADMGQLRSVNQLSDVRPTDWAYQALRSLVERYSCVAGYPNGTFRGNRAMTRYEAAALVNACLDTVNDLIAQATADLVTQEDLAQLQRLQEEFREELAVLRARVDSLEAKVEELEANQFSTTTKLKGEAIFSLNDSFGEDTNDNATFGGRVRLNLDTSFTGSDLLRTRLEAENIQDFSGTIPLAELTYSGDNTARSGEPDFALDDLWYRFSIGKGEFTVGPVGVDSTNFVPTTAWHGSFVSDFLSDPPGYDTQGDEAGLGGNYQFNDYFNLAAAYIADNTADGNGVSGGGRGVFADDYTAFAQLTGTVGKFEGVLLGSYTDDQGSSIGLFNGNSTTWGADPFGGVASSQVLAHIGASYQFSERFIVQGFGTHGWASQSGSDNSAQSYSAGLGFVFPDLFREGNEGGIAVGVAPHSYDNDVSAREDDETPILIDLYYDFRISDNITITPAGIIVFNGDGGRDGVADDTTFVGAIKTKFKF
jgi:hypothetical protein